MGDFNAKVGSERDNTGSIGPYGLGDTIEAGDFLAKIMSWWSQILGFNITVEGFIGLLGLIAPDHKTRSQIDYFIRRRKRKLKIKK